MKKSFIEEKKVELQNTQKAKDYFSALMRTRTDEWAFEKDTSNTLFLDQQNHFTILTFTHCFNEHYLQMLHILILKQIQMNYFQEAFHANLSN